MNSFEFNKIAGAVLGTLLATMALGILGEVLFEAEEPEQPGWAVAVPEEGTGGAEVAEEQVTPLPVRLASADADAGADIHKRCLSCHSFEAGGPNKVGPGLHDIVGRLIAAHEGFNYSEAFQERAAEGFEWTYEHLDGFLTSPRDYIPGTAMAFAGIKDPEDRADLIAFLRTVTENPPPLPEPEAAPAAEEAAASEGAEQPTLEPAAPAEQPTAPESPETAEPQAAQAPQQEQGEPQQASPTLGVNEQQVPSGTGAPVQPAPEDQESLTGSGGQTPAPAEQQPVQQAPAEGQQGAAEPAQQEAAAPASGLIAEIAATDVADGESQARKCMACHSLEEGGANRVGPHIYGVVGRQVAGVEDYNYSEALQGIGGEWTLDKLDAFLTNPREYAKGTKMAFPGIKDDDDRHALLHYLYTLQENPQPLQ